MDQVGGGQGGQRRLRVQLPLGCQPANRGQIGRASLGEEGAQ
jgi:hypothetical protein